MNLIKFFFGKIKPKDFDSNSLYFVKSEEDAHGSIYKGSELIAESNENIEAELESAKDRVQNLEDSYFVGTYARYVELNSQGKIKEGCIVFITDDNGSGGSNPPSEDGSSESATLGYAILGQMKLGYK